ncbi:MAG: hypothetical protein AAF433_15480, partial [Bacteroidota bacterium]
MSVSSHPEIPLWVQNRIVGFFNQVRNVGMILDGSIKDDPADGPGRTISRPLAARILRERNQLERRRFTDLEQIDSIRGIGPNTIQDLVYSFGISADEAFLNAMYNSGTIYRENWPLEYFRYTLDDTEVFQGIANNREQLRKFIVDKVALVAREREVTEAARAAMLQELENAYIDDYHNSSPNATYALA